MTNRSPRRLPEEIYVRRRVAAAVGILVLVGLLVWGLVAFAGRGGDTTDTAATTTTAPVTTETPKSSSATTSATETTETTATTAASTSEETQAAEAKDSCALSDLVITASSDRPSYGGGVQPTFYMTVANPTNADCEINLDDEELRFEVYNLENNQRVWADTDCYPSVLTGDETFEGQDERRFQAVWSRLGSAPGQCNNRQDVGTGSFYLHAVIGNNPSDAHTFNLG